MDPRKKRIRRVIKLAAATAPLPPQEIGKGKAGPGRGYKADAARRGDGHRREYLVARIARDRPDILARMQAGEFEYVWHAAIEAGIIKPKARPEARV
jgi:hypothetical protein